VLEYLWQYSQKDKSWPDKWISYDDTVPSHTILMVKEFLARKYIPVFEHPLYSYDLFSYDFLMILKLQIS
jgi:hypothetical protein